MIFNFKIMNPIALFKKWLLNKLVPFIERTNKKENKKLEAYERQ